MSSTKTWLTNTKRTPFVTRSITEHKDTFVRNVTSGTQNTDVTGDMSNKTPSARDVAEVTHGFGSRG
jgi:isopentenyl phosphate kinase